ncbi:sister chromatid cohesion protein PDS5 homolog A isoform X2 [Ischnura elegans]|uniref:sister chromatid cohesion protein PDS5 homolog A isoform X2 n=1 Tax=Ischnura elegans TaxID=197161 RepID=UPI001ED8A31B|nr:sister chromatid cohesion protein PDS5 homolog A isoform X2 [Ischnura elegans]
MPRGGGGSGSGGPSGACSTSAGMGTSGGTTPNTVTVTIVYPQGCREVTEDLGPDELIRRLKTLAHTFQSMGQDEGAYQEYVPLALHLAEDYFLLHPSRDVQLLIACCIADVLRVYAPEAPYKDPEQVKTIFLFLIKQLAGLKDPKDPAFKRYFYLLENLAYVKSFNMCFELEDCQEIFCALFSLMFKIVNDEHSGKVKSFMLDVLCPVITESDVVSNELLDIILMNVVEPNKSQRKNAYLLAKELVVKCSDTLEPYIQTFFNHVLILGREEKKLGISRKVYDLIYELNHICPSVLLSVLPQLEFKLKSTEESERMGSVSLLARMFSEKDSTLAIHHRQLWQAFLGRFNDISVAIRNKCVQYSMHFLLNHPELRRDITETLKLRQHDSEETVRYEVVMAIVTTARRDFSVVSDSEDLLDFVKERTLDKKFKIRKEAMCGLAMIYKKHLSNPDVPEATKKAVTWIKDKILHGYYMTGMDDRLLVERLLNTCLVPYQLPAEERMKKLYYLLGTIDENATKAFIELQKHQLAVRKNVAELIELHKRLPTSTDGNEAGAAERDRELAARINFLSKFLPDSVKAQEFIKKFSVHLTQDPQLLRAMEIVVNPDVGCKECADTVTQILKKLGQPVMTNLYYNTVKMLLERISSVMVDKEALKILVGYVEQCLKGGPLIEEIGLNPGTAGERGLRLLYVLSFVFPSHFLHRDVITHLLNFLSIEEELVAPLVLSVLTFVGKYKPIGEAFPDIGKVLIPLCQNFAETGTPKQAKQAIRCLFVNIVNNQDLVFTEILEKLKENLTHTSPYYRTAIVSLGHIAYNLPDKFPIQIKNIVSRKIVKDLLMKDLGERKHFIDEDWCVEDELPEETRCKIEGMKMMARWLLGLKTDIMSAQKTYRMLSAVISRRGDLLDEGKLSKAEMAWLRLAAGCSMLKVCEQKGVGDQFTAEQFYNLSLLMNDEVLNVRETFASKLHKGLSRGIPQKCLPLDFMGYYALAGQESDRRLRAQIRQNMVADINKRREYIKSITMTGGFDKAADQLPHIMPDYMLVFAVPVLAHDPEFTSYEDHTQLQRARQCLWFVLEPLMTRNEGYCFGFYKTLVERMKMHVDALRSGDDKMNYKLWAICDLAMGLIVSKTTNFEMKEFPAEPRIPPMYFKRHEDPLFINHRIYLPQEFIYLQPKKGGHAGEKIVAGSASTPGAPAAAISSVGANATGCKKGKGKGRIPSGGSAGSGLDVERTEDGPGHIDAEPAEASDTKIQLPGIEETDLSASHGDSSGEEAAPPPPKKRKPGVSPVGTAASESAAKPQSTPSIPEELQHPMEAAASSSGMGGRSKSAAVLLQEEPNQGAKVVPEGSVTSEGPSASGRLQGETMEGVEVVKPKEEGMGEVSGETLLGKAEIKDEDGVEDMEVVGGGSSRQGEHAVDRRKRVGRGSEELKSKAKPSPLASGSTGTAKRVGRPAGSGNKSKGETSSTELQKENSSAGSRMDETSSDSTANTDSTTQKAVSAPLPRKRGRPPKSDSASLAKAGEDSTKRKRLSVDECEGEENDDGMEGEDEEPRKKSVKHKRKEELTVLQDSDNESDGSEAPSEEEATAVEKRGVGRPRGRPRGAKNNRGGRGSASSRGSKSSGRVRGNVKPSDDEDEASEESDGVDGKGDGSSSVEGASTVNGTECKETDEKRKGRKPSKGLVNQPSIPTVVRAASPGPSGRKAAQSPSASDDSSPVRRTRRWK